MLVSLWPWSTSLNRTDARPPVPPFDVVAFVDEDNAVGQRRGHLCTRTTTACRRCFPGRGAAVKKRTSSLCRSTLDSPSSASVLRRGLVDPAA